MSDRVVSKRMAKKEGKYKKYKGKAPFSLDQFLKWILKMILQVIIFSAIYYFNIESVREEYNYNPVMEFFVIISWLFFTDFIVAISVWIIKMIVLYKLDYLASNKKNNNAGLWLWEYIIYSLIRAFCYLVLLTLFLTSLFATVMPEIFAFVLAWITVSLSSRLLAKVGSILITKQVP